MAEHPEDVADAFRAALTALSPGARIHGFRIDGLDRLGMPVAQAALVAGEAPALIGYGYGLDPLEAELSALGEVCEEAHVGAAMDRLPVVRASHAGLLAEGRAAADPLTLCLPAGSPYHPGLPLDWVAARRWPDGNPVLVPRDWVAAYRFQLGRAPELIVPITNGLGAGLDLEHAIAHGVMELLQRDGNVTSFRALDEGVVVALDDAVPADVLALLERLRAAGIAPLVKLASTGFGIPGLYVVGDDAAPGLPIQLTACGEAAHPDRARALRKALLEFVGSRSRKAATHGPVEQVCAALPPAYAARQLQGAGPQHEEPRALAAMAEWVGADAATLRRRLSGSVLAERRRVAFSSLPTVPAAAVERSADRLALLAARLAAAGLPILYVDCSPPEGRVPPGLRVPPGPRVRVVRVIVPGLESETMSYARIGWRGVRRLRERGHKLVQDGPAEGARRVRLTPEDEARAGGPAWFDAGLAERLVGPLYPLYRETGQFSAQLARGAARAGRAALA